MKQRKNKIETDMPDSTEILFASNDLAEEFFLISLHAYSLQWSHDLICCAHVWILCIGLLYRISRYHMALSLRTLFRGTRVGLITQMQKCQQAMNHTSWRFLETRPSSCSSQASAARIFAVDVRDKDLVITWRDDDKLDSLTAKMPYSYLRDNSHLSQSRARSHGHAYLKFADFGTNINIAAKHVGIGEDGQQLTITWSDGYRGCFQSSWLLQHRTGTGAVSSRLPVEQNLWDSSSFSYGLSVCLSVLS